MGAEEVIDYGLSGEVSAEVASEQVARVFEVVRVLSEAGLMSAGTPVQLGEIGWLSSLFSEVVFSSQYDEATVACSLKGGDSVRVQCREQIMELPKTISISESGVLGVEDELTQIVICKILLNYLGGYAFEKVFHEKKIYSLHTSHYTSCFSTWVPWLYYRLEVATLESQLQAVLDLPEYLCWWDSYHDA